MLPIREIGILDGRKRSSLSRQRKGLGCRSGARTGQKKTAQQESQSFYRHIVQYRLGFHQWKLDPKQLILPDDPYIAGNQQPVARGEVLQPDSGPRRRIDFRNNGIGNREHTAFGTDCDAQRPGKRNTVMLDGRSPQAAATTARAGASCGTARLYSYRRTACSGNGSSADKGRPR